MKGLKELSQTRNAPILAKLERRGNKTEGPTLNLIVLCACAKRPCRMPPRLAPVGLAGPPIGPKYGRAGFLDKTDGSNHAYPDA
jgi:hypothetical protein